MSKLYISEVLEGARKYYLKRRKGLIFRELVRPIILFLFSVKHFFRKHFFRLLLSKEECLYRNLPLRY